MKGCIGRSMREEGEVRMGRDVLEGAERDRKGGGCRRERGGSRRFAIVSIIAKRSRV